jgi:hypothetical protein
MGNSMPRRLRNLIVFLILLIPSAQFAWRNRDMAEFAYLHDDGMFFVSAKSLATGNGYRIPSLPENPHQTKFPPLYPLFLSAVWLLSPAFPANLALATLFCWVTLVAGLWLTRILYKSDGFSERRVWLLVALLSFSPYLILFGSTMFSEMLFTCFVLAAFIMGRRQGNKAILAAGALALCAYLTRTAGIALLVAIPAWLLWKRESRKAVLFGAVVLPGVIAWSLWVRFHLFPGADSTLFYYTDYFMFEKLNVDFTNLNVVLWRNADQILYAMGSLVLPQVVEFLPIKILTQVLGVAMISGVVRLVRRKVAIDYALFALVSCGILLVWHYPPNERMILPMAPLLLAGFITESEHLWNMFRPALKHKDVSQRVAAVIFGGGVAMILVVAAGVQGYVTFFHLTETNDGKRVTLADRKVAYQWIAANVPSTATVLSYDDPLLYLYSGHRGNYMPMMPRWWYAEDHEHMISAYKNVVPYCRARGLSYIYFTTEDLSRETGEDDRRAVEASIRANPELEPVFTSGIGTVYRIRPTSP